MGQKGSGEQDEYREKEPKISETTRQRFATDY